MNISVDSQRNSYRTLKQNINDIKKIAFICSDCIKCTDDMFRFRSRCLRNNSKLKKYISQLRLDKNDILDITSQLTIIEQKIEMVDDPDGLKSITRLNEDENVLQSEDILNTTCDGELRTEEHIKKEVLDDDVIDKYQSESIYGNDNTNSYSKTNSDNNVDSSTETNESFKDTSNNINIDINKRIKCETFDYNVGKYEPEFENVSVNDNVNNTFETNVDRTATGLNDPLQNNSNIEGYQYVKVKMDDISSLHTEYNVNDCIKNETSNESVVKHLSEKNEFSLNTNVEDNVDSVSKICGINLNPNVSAESIIDATKTNDDSDEAFLRIHINDLPVHKNKTMCYICNKSFTTIPELQNHILKTHAWNKTTTYENHNSGSNELREIKKSVNHQNEEKPFKCGTCNKSFNHPSSLSIHNRIHTGEKNYICEICNKTFVSSCDYIRHTRTHTGEKPYKCEICDKTFSRSYLLVTHNRIHTGERPYKCETCERSFNQLSHLKSHTLIHSGEKPYKCYMCDKSFISSHCYKRHIRVHKDDKPYKCEICYKSFVSSGDHKRHIRIHTGEKPYKCDICDKSFTFLSSFKGHKVTHTKEKPYVCKICNKSFRHSSTLNSHSKIHSGEKPYKCDMCDKSFSRSSILIMHSRIHSGEKPFECEICNKPFNLLCNLKRHFKTHSEEKL